MPNKFVLASAGAGKTTTLVDDALSAVRENRSVLFLTYTQNNQAEIIRKFREINGCIPSNVQIKGWFSFLLEDLIRPYQRCIFNTRITNIVFDQSDPHKRNGRNITGRSEKINNHTNSRHYLSNNKAHTTYISKLATRICERGKSGRGITASYDVIDRLDAIYDLIIIDEVQDLVGWDFSILDLMITKPSITLQCVGDFRQTIYQTSHANKNPKTSQQKRQWFVGKGFECLKHNHSWRCVEQICWFADIVHSHQKYKATTSKIENIPVEFQEHVGIFVISYEHINTYLEMYKPVILRQNKSTQEGICKGFDTQNFGAAKGLGFNRVLILPTDNYLKFLQGGPSQLRDANTEIALNKLYVAITRAKYSVAFLSDKEPMIKGISVWTP